MTKEFLLFGPVNSQWVGCDLAVVKFGRNAYVKIVFDGRRQIFLYGPRERLTWALRACADILDGREPEPMVTEFSQAASSSVANLVTPGCAGQDPSVTKTPAEVAAYFRASPDLAMMADDVEEALAGQIGLDQVSRDLAAVLAVCDAADLVDEGGKAIRGAQSRIAEALDIPNAGSHNRPRIRAILECLQARSNSTTTTKPSGTAKNSDLRRLEAS